MNKIFKGINILINYIIANTIGRLLYNSKYMKGKHFNNIRSLGWKWVSRGVIYQKLLGNNKEVPWPVSHRIVVGNYKNIEFNIDDLHIFQLFGNYYQAWSNKIIIGKGAYVAPNVGIITSNHDLYDLDKRMQGKDVVIGDNSWIGMNSMILPGVKLGKNTIVGAGSVVTKSFEEGYCVIGGNPARKIKDLVKDSDVK